MKEHEVQVKNKAGDVFVVSKAYYERNKDKLTKVTGKKMESEPLKNKSA